MFGLFKKENSSPIPMAISYVQRLQLIVGNPLVGFPKDISKWSKEKEKSIEDFMKEYGLTTDQAMRLQQVLFLLDEWKWKSSSSPKNAKEWASLKEAEEIRNKDHEYLLMFIVNEKGNYTHHLLSVGSEEEVSFPPFEQMKSLLEQMKGTAFVLMHNHPSGDARISNEDIDVTLQLSRFFQSTRYMFLDHIIVAKGGTSYSSLRENGYVFS
ncbi:JAB domain-containing protein [Neobacillus sp. YIM B02564]|uniref:JAB domain-containing protein n=1 Tax=Neobacillus paridis TaxID=2803862 RepID=A0ABS1TLH1_9BACI|nr:JAB domain-containing protein [Neobacillus paridis]MBL4952112.1 JAB domain-containing protein [Neobacillus paridis]